MVQQEFNLNLVPDQEPVVVYVDQYDIGTGRLLISLFNGDVPYTPSSGATVRIQGTKPDGHGFDNTASITGSLVMASVTQQMTMVPGDVRTQIVVTESNRRTGSFAFILRVQKSALPDDTDMSRSDYTLIQQCFQASEAAISAANSAESSKTAAAASKTAAANSATAAAASATQAASSANSAANSATRAETARALSDNNVNVSRQYANQAAQSAEDGRLWAKSWAVYSSNADKYGHDTNNSQFWADRSRYFYEKTVALSASMQQKLNAVIEVIKMLIGAVNIATQSGDSLITQSGDHLVISFAEELYLTTNSGDRVLTENGNVITVTR